jgi:hypothetical protein
MNKFSRFLLGSAGAFAMAANAGCFFIIEDPEGDIALNYVILVPDANDGDGDLNFDEPVAIRSCDEVDAQFLTVEVFSGNNAIAFASQGCNQEDLDNDNILQAEDLGFFQGTFPAGTFDSFQISLEDSNGDRIPIALSNTGAGDFAIFGAVEVFANDVNLLPFQQDPNGPPTLVDELQLFVGF